MFFPENEKDLVRYLTHFLIFTTSLRLRAMLKLDEGRMGKKMCAFFSFEMQLFTCVEKNLIVILSANKKEFLYFIKIQKMS
jgi:hypothetical protein